MNSVRSVDADGLPLESTRPGEYTTASVNPSAFVAPPERRTDSQPPVSARALYARDVASGAELYATNGQAAVPIASTTKLMTAVLSLELYTLDQVLTVPQEAVDAIGSDIQLRAGEEISVENLLNGLLIQSGNDAAVTLASGIGLDSFVQKMNEKAIQLGMSNTKYKDPAGLDDTGYSTARDLSIVASYALRFPVILKVAKLTELTIYSSDGRTAHKLETSNRLIKPDHPLFLDFVTGLKTGFTPDAGHCLVASGNRGGHEVVTVVLGTTEQTNEASAKESRKLLQWVYDSYSWN